MGRIMAIDLGDVRVGIAVSDIMQIIANGLETYRRSGSDIKDMEYIANLAKQQQVELIVMGLPRNMDGSYGERADLYKAFGEKLSEVAGLKVVYLDERLTTVSAQRVLLEADMRRDKRKEVIDKVAATIILQNYLQFKR